MTFALLLLYIIICILRSESDAFIHTSQFSGVPLAQRIARWTSNPKVLGSIPRWDDTFFYVSQIMYISRIGKYCSIQSVVSLV